MEYCFVLYLALETRSITNWCLSLSRYSNDSVCVS